jgi:hypothetical protein
MKKIIIKNKKKKQYREKNKEKIKEYRQCKKLLVNVVELLD